MFRNLRNNFSKRLFDKNSGYSRKKPQHYKSLLKMEGFPGE